MAIISSIKEDELQSEIKENVNDSVSYRLENAVKISSNTSFECELSEKITQFDDSSIHQMVDFICSSTEIKENGVKISTNTSIECEQGGRITLLGDSIVQEMVDYAGSSIKEDELKQELTGKCKFPPFSSDSENGFKTNFDITGIHDSNIQEKQEIFPLNITEAQNDVQSAISHDNFVFLKGLKGNFTDDNFVVVEIQEDLGKDCNLISQSHNLIEMSSNGLRRSEDNWDRFVNVNNVNQKIGGKKGWDKWVVQNGDKKLEILEIQGKGNEKMKVSSSNNRKPPANHSAGVSTNVMNNFRIVPRIGNEYQRKEIYEKRVRSYYSENIKQDFNRKKENFSKRNWNGIIKEKPSLLMVLAEARNACPKKVDGYKRRYSRNELEALRFVNCDEQRQIWKEIYTGLGPVVARELYFAAESSNQLRNGRNGSNIRNNDQNQQAGKQKVNAPILALPGAPKGRGTHLPIVEVKSC